MAMQQEHTDPASTSPSIEDAGTATATSSSGKGPEPRGVRPLKQRRCLKCGAKRKLTRDHVIPKVILNARGIPHHEFNNQKLCEPCNMAKGSRRSEIVDYRSHHEHEMFRWWVEQVGLEDIRVRHEPRGHF